MMPEPDKIVPKPDDEGEPQTVFLSPTEACTYIRNPDGSLIRVDAPTIIPGVSPQE